MGSVCKRRRVFVKMMWYIFMVIEWNWRTVVGDHDSHKMKHTVYFIKGCGVTRGCFITYAIYDLGMIIFFND